ncbi:hypothetical protein OQA88_1236 [Cercophora sp. LCS_1]
MSDLQNMTREEKLAFMAKHVEEVKKQHPEWDTKSEEQWWAPSVHYGYDLKEALDKETHGKLNAAILKMQKSTFDPDVIAQVRAETQTILAGHPELLERTNTMLFDKSGVWDKVREWALKEVAEGKPNPFDKTCAGGSCST